MIVAMVQDLNTIQLFMHRPKIPKIFWKYQATPLAKLQKAWDSWAEPVQVKPALYPGKSWPCAGIFGVFVDEDDQNSCK